MNRLLLFLLLLCAPAFADIVVEDESGQSVHLAEPAQRIVSLAPHITETLFAIGAGDRIVATVSHSDYPAAAKAIPIVGSYHRVNAERLLAMQPDLVIAWREGNSPALIQHLRSLGLTVFVTNPRKLHQIPDAVQNFARLTGREEHGTAVADRFTRDLAALHKRHRDRTPVTVFYQVWDDPLLTLNGANLISEVIDLCGGVNVFADVAPPHPVVSVESVLQANPQVIVASGMGEERPDWLDAWQRWPSRAARNRQLYFIPPSVLQRHSTRILEGASLMCRHLEQARRHYGQRTATGESP